jgi:hypothetical protein
MPTVLAGRDDLGCASTALVAFRTGFYGSLTRWADALFELSDAVLCSPAPISSVPALSLEPTFRRSHGSLYKALDRGAVDAEAIRDLLVAHRPADWPLVFAVDASSWPRCDAETSPERGFYYHPSRHSAGQPIVAGWSYQWITQLDWAADSWTAPVDARRIPPTADTVETTITQIRELVRRLGADRPVPTFVFDAGYDPIALSAGLADDPVAVVVRIRSDRVFYADPPARTDTTIGRPRRHGDRFGCADPASWPTPDDELFVEDPRYGRVHVQAWRGLHPKLAGRGRWASHDAPPIVEGTVIRAQVEHLPKPTSRALKLCGSGGPDPPDRTSTCAGGPTYAASTSNIPTDSPRTPSAGPPPRYALPNRPTAGPGSSSPATPNCGSPAPSSTTCGCPGNDPSTPANSPPPGAAEGFADSAQHSTRQPVHRNQKPPALDGPKAPTAPRASAIRRSRRPRSKGLIASLGLADQLAVFHAAAGAWFVLCGLCD